MLTSDYALLQCKCRIFHVGTAMHRRIKNISTSLTQKKDGKKIVGVTKAQAAVSFKHFKSAMKDSQ